MNFGVKTFDDHNFLKYFEKKADFFEIMASQKVNHSFLKQFSIPMVIHAEHQAFGVNITDIKKKELNLKSINYAIKLANMVNSKKIILHSGVLENKDCSVVNAISFLEEIDDERILIENLPFKDNGRKVLCSTPEETKEFLKKTNRNFCFDVNHAIISSVFNKKDYFEEIKRFLRLNPKHFHIGGQNMKTGKDHLSFMHSDLDIKKILKSYPKNAEITLETETDINSVDFDLEFIRKIIN
jgi:sugar phosphate isomerase/epimerase